MKYEAPRAETWTTLNNTFSASNDWEGDIDIVDEP
jgi:hypothetical protein